MDVFAKVKTLVAEQLAIEEEEVSLKTTFEDIDADSLDVVELVMSIEEEFEMEISDEEVEKIRTIGDIVEYIKKQL